MSRRKARRVARKHPWGVASRRLPALRSTRKGDAMTRRLFLLATMVCLVMVSTVPAQAGAESDDLHRTGLTRARSLARWALGGSPSPLLSAFEGDCGDRVGNAFFLAPPIGQDMELRCRVPLDTAIVFSHAAWFTTIPA